VGANDIVFITFSSGTDAERCELDWTCWCHTRVLEERALMVARNVTFSPENWPRSPFARQDVSLR
jgi:hypothetical protein